MISPGRCDHRRRTRLGASLRSRASSSRSESVFVGRSQGKLDQAAASIGAGVRIFPADVTDAKRVAAIFAEIGPVDLLVNNAGVLGPLGPFAQCDFDQWWDVNVRGARILLTHTGLPNEAAFNAHHGGWDLLQRYRQSGQFTAQAAQLMRA